MGTDSDKNIVKFDNLTMPAGFNQESNPSNEFIINLDGESEDFKDPEPVVRLTYCHLIPDDRKIFLISGFVKGYDDHYFATDACKVFDWILNDESVDRIGGEITNSEELLSFLEDVKVPATDTSLQEFRSGGRRSIREAPPMSKWYLEENKPHPSSQSDDPSSQLSDSPNQLDEQTDDSDQSANWLRIHRKRDQLFCVRPENINVVEANNDPVAGKSGNKNHNVCIIIEQGREDIRLSCTDLEGQKSFVNDLFNVIEGDAGDGTFADLYLDDYR